ncbi:MAG: hypothetical protein JSV94_02080 [Methanobacteriota archaeon]|nr:MAG: hypothetical protein JSV94_02080 [Euryarchaeota archaeon]
MKSAGSSIIVVFILCASVFLPSSSAARCDVTDVVILHHKMTSDDADRLRRTCGVFEPAKNYNVIVDGFGTGLSPLTEEELVSMVGVVNVHDAIEADFGELPEAVNLSALPTFPAVGNQSSQPSCAAWAATYYAYGFQEATDNDWTLAPLGEPSQLISPAWTYARSNAGRDLGSNMESNMRVIQDWGAATMATMPFDEYEYVDMGSPSAFREAPAHRASEVFNIEYSGASTIEEIKLLVAEGIPVTFGIDANEYYPAFSDGNHIITSQEYDSLDLNHAQTIVGYNDTITDDDEVGAFWVVNSWGDGWGIDGFYWFTYDALMELGATDKAQLDYLLDIEDYSPSLVANWHFNDPPSRAASLEIGVGSMSSPVASKIPFSIEDRIGSHSYPTFMCVDITEFVQNYEDSNENFFLDVGASPSRGTISSFKIESHEGAFSIGSPSRSSGQSIDVPRTTPGAVTVIFPRYDVVNSDDAVDASGVTFTCASGVSWVPVEDSSAVDEDSIQSGDVGDGETSSLALAVEGPAVLAFSWKVSSEEGSDILHFSVPNDDIRHAISGDVDWTDVSYSLGEGTHTAYWNYTKDSDTSELDDTAWLDDIRISMASPQFSLQESYAAVLNVPLEVTPIDIVNPSGSQLSFWYDWGDGTAITSGNPTEGHSASHVYETIDSFVLTVWAADEHDNNVSESAVVQVMDGNAMPLVRSISIAPLLDYYSPGDMVRFDVEVADAEGDTVTVIFSVESSATTMTDTDTPEPGAPFVFSFDFICPESREEPYTAEVEVRDDEEHFAYDWDQACALLLVNSPPVVSVESDQSQGDTSVIFDFDASSSYDAETSTTDLCARWDWNGDGGWDTDWLNSLEASHQFESPGTYIVVVEIMDGSGLTSTGSIEINVGGDAIPEFPLLLLPIVVVLLLFALISRARCRRRS